VGAPVIKGPPTEDVERFLSLLSFDLKGKLAESGIESAYLSLTMKK